MNPQDIKREIEGGYAGKVLDINLNKKEVSSRALNENFARKYLGGKGFVAKTLWDELDKNTDPLSEENILVFAPGPMTGIAPASGRMTVGARFPLTETHGHCNVGGEFGTELKHAGYDLMIIRGKSEDQIYIQIEDENVTFKDASHLWGKRTHETIEGVRSEFDENAQIACIGPAGENLVYLSGICFNPDRYAALGGLGAVMGSKNFKAIGVKGTKGIPIANKKQWKEYYQNILEIYQGDETTVTGREIGSNFLTSHHNEKNALVVKNLQFGSTNVEDVDGKALNERYVVKNRSGCSLCPISCQRRSEIDEGKYAGTTNNGPEYTTVAHFGWRLGVMDLENIIYNAELCDELGLDCENTPCVIGFAMELYQRGIISSEDVDGYNLHWGNKEAVTELIEKIAHREGIGDVFADGILGTIEHFGPESEYYAMHVKGNDIPPNEPRAGHTYNMRYAIASRGADHLQASGVSKSAGEFKGDIDDLPPEESMKWFKDLEHACMIINLLDVCNWAYAAYSSSFDIVEYKIENLLGILNASTGWNMDMDELQTAAERIIVFERAINSRYGFRRDDDYLPKRCLEERCPSELDEDTYSEPITDFDERLDAYYKHTGIEKETGIPKRETLEELDLSDVADELEKIRGGE